MKKAVFLDADTLFDSPLLPLQELPLSWSFYHNTKPNEVAQRLESAEIVVSNKVLLTREVLKHAKHLKMISTVSTGYDHIDIVAAKELGIVVSNIPQYSTASVVQFTITLMLALFTNLFPYVEATRHGKWETSPQFCYFEYPIFELEGKILGIVGYGNLGKQIERLAKALGMRILIAQHSTKQIPGAVPLEKLLQESDAVTIHTPLTPETKNLIGKKELALMKSSAFLINTSRGGIVDEQALADALKSKRIAGAALDVLSQEPPKSNNPLLQKNVPNLLLTPHVAWASAESRMRLLQALKGNLASFLAGTPKNLIA